ncbi:hypothetical protein G5B38_14300 [Pseudohalocynthiibacter aestuariivivens]|nr:hypothetical protein [Pseudohalocynthiibacter aestuariivivens]QIE46599.1 hypothetical protein G5B38_14300 [Pseudohalocynthiibacter aestuariivivens]
MSKQYFSRTLSAAVFLALTALPGHAQDSDGCYNASGCVSSSSKWSGNKLITTIHNKCAGGIYIKVCTRRTKGKPDCGASHVNGRSKYTFSGYNAHSSGDARYTWVGSMRSSKDWVCTGKVSGWHDSLF